MAEATIKTGQIRDAAVTEAKIGLSDNTTNNVSITKHGFVPKAPNNSSQVLLGDGTWGAAPGGGGGITAAQAIVYSIIFG